MVTQQDTEHTYSCLCGNSRAMRRMWGFPGSSAGKKPACNAGDPGSVPGS